MADHREYAEEPQIEFVGSDYTGALDLEDGAFALLLSQWAGPIGQSCKRYLRVGGLLVANDSHGDATLAALDADYELVAVYPRAGQKKLKERDLGSYFVPKSTAPTRENVLATGRGTAYTKQAASYVFRRVG